MAQAIWSGSISFGLIGIPVKLYPATKRNDVRFHEVERATGRRVRHRRVVEDAGEPYGPVTTSVEEADPLRDAPDPEPGKPFPAAAGPSPFEDAEPDEP